MTAAPPAERQWLSSRLVSDVAALWGYDPLALTAEQIESIESWLEQIST